MTSKVTIEVNHSTYMPYFRVIHDHKSDDVRDKLIGEFIKKLSPRSFWCRVQYGPDIENKMTLHIVPLEGEDLEDNASKMLEQSKSYWMDRGRKDGEPAERPMTEAEHEIIANGILKFLADAESEGIITPKMEKTLGKFLAEK